MTMTADARKTAGMGTVIRPTGRIIPACPDGRAAAARSKQTPQGQREKRNGNGSGETGGLCEGLTARFDGGGCGQAQKAAGRIEKKVLQKP